MKNFFLPFLLFFFSTFLAHASFRPIDGIDDPKIRDIAISPFYPNLVYLASVNSLYKSTNGGESFQKVDSFIDEEIKQIFFHSKEVGVLYLVTSRRLYQITDRKASLFTSDDEQIVLSAANHNGVLYVGTSQGLYFSDQDYLNWKRLEGLTGRPVYWIEPGQEYIYFAAADGVYIFDGRDRLRRTFILRKTEADEIASLVLNELKIDIFDKEKIWLATSKGLFVSKDYGESFDKFFVSGIDNLNINSLTQTNLEEESLYLATERGFFRVGLKQRRARGLYTGLYASRVNRAKFTKEGKIYLATDRGIFTNQYFSLAACNRKLKGITDNQPSIEFVHQAAMDFNEVSPEKIKEWRRRASLSPLFPRMALKYDKSLAHRGGATYKYWSTGPRDWGVTFTWDIGDFVWNPSHTSIDTRSRLNTQLRLDILDSVNRIYFERLRIKKQSEVESLPAEERLSKNLRLRELTAMLDYYTGGAFSRRLQELNSQ